MSNEQNPIIGFIRDDADDHQRRQILEILDRERREYEARIKPWLDMLAGLERMRMSPRIVIDPGLLDKTVVWRKEIIR